MITIATAENALKNIYLDTVINDINKKTNPFLTMVEENTRIASGKDAKFSIRYGQASVGVGTETGDLPVGENEKSKEIAKELTNRAIESLTSIDGDHTTLLSLTDFLLNRNY